MTLDEPRPRAVFDALRSLPRRAFKRFEDNELTFELLFPLMFELLQVK